MLLRNIFALPLVAALALAGLSSAGPTPPVYLAIDPALPGRVFEGIGAVSAGASSRLLADYPEPARSQVLDYLFKPGFGASLQHLKVEIGGDVNSTDGVEPSHMRHPGEENFTRGYEWWLMKEAKSRNPDMIFDCLAWGAPGWVGGGNYFSPDMADYIVAFIRGARDSHGIDIRYTGVWNEMPWDKEWVKHLRQKLDAAGLAHVGIVAADQYDGHKWKVAEMMQADPDLAAAVAVVGVHYPEGNSPETARASGFRLWSSEDGSKPGDWRNAGRVARLFNRNYAGGRMTKTLVWAPVGAFYDNLPYARTGFFQANEPWSGHYKVEPAVWIAAHTTQFAKPGWQYLDAACKLLDGGSVVALRSPDGRDFSVMVEAMDAKQPLVIDLATRGFRAAPVHVWTTSEQAQFVRQPDLQPVNGRISFSVQPGTLCTLGTSGGQTKGEAAPPPRKPFPLPFRQNFDTCATGQSPAWFSDVSGVFETVARPDGGGKALRQILSKPGILWMHPNPEPFTLLGDRFWRDYTVAVDVRLAAAGSARLYGRTGEWDQGAQPPASYSLAWHADGRWELLCSDWEFSGGKSRVATRVLAQGTSPAKPAGWHRLTLGFHGDRISASIDGKELAGVQDATHPDGNVALGCGWNVVDFDNLEITGKALPQCHGTMSASSVWDDNHRADDANDGLPATRWNAAADQTIGQWLELDFGAESSVSAVSLRQFENRVQAFRIQRMDGGNWRDVVAGNSPGAYHMENFPPVRTRRLRLLMESTNGKEPSIREFMAFRPL